jgi:hypothetical protein
VDPARIAAILNRHTNRNPYRSELVDQMILGGLQKNYGTIRLTIVTDETIKTRVADLLRRSGELRFQTPELVAMLSDSLRHNEAEVARGDGLDVRTLALPPGGGQFLKTAAKPGVLRALNGLRLHKLLARIDAQPVARAPALLYLSGPSDRASLVDAGRLLERTWIHLNAAGIAVHPYYALSDQLHRFAANRIALPLLPQAGALAAQAHEVLDFGPGELPQMILRIGYPVRPAPRSRRLPSAAVGLD